MMALNFQTNGIEMQINTTMFEENGLCGYVLKPHILRDPAANINIFGDSIHSTVLANRIEIKVYVPNFITYNIYSIFFLFFYLFVILS